MSAAVASRAGEITGLVEQDPRGEQIAGFCVLECTDMNEALEVASRHPTALVGTFELRPYAE
jgi:hypothetical protein